MGHLGIKREGPPLFLRKVDRRFPLPEAILSGSRARGDELYDQ